MPPAPTAACIKYKISTSLKKALNGLIDVDDLIGNENDDNLGTHSVRKYASTRSRLLGISKDDKDHRGRWHRLRISDRYDDIQLDYVDAKVAAALCPTGVCDYVVVDPACTGSWISTVVSPNIKAVFGETLAILFGKALLWACYSVDTATLLPPPMKARICEAYEQTRTIEDGRNPVEKRVVHVTGEEGRVFMETEEPDVDAVMEEAGTAGTIGQAVITTTVTHRRRRYGNGNNRDMLLSNDLDVNWHEGLVCIVDDLRLMKFQTSDQTTKGFLSRLVEWFEHDCLQK